MLYLFFLFIFGNYVKRDLVVFFEDCYEVFRDSVKIKYYMKEIVNFKVK